MEDYNKKLEKRKDNISLFFKVVIRLTILNVLGFLGALLLISM